MINSKLIHISYNNLAERQVDEKQMATTKPSHTNTADLFFSTARQLSIGYRNMYKPVNEASRLVQLHPAALISACQQDIPLHS